MSTREVTTTSSSERATRPPSSWRNANVRLQDRAGGAHGDLEALAGGAELVTVEQHCNLVARRVLELFHHEAAAPRRRTPVHVSQRLPLDVLPDAVQLVPGRAAQEQPPAVLCVRPAFGEEPGERDEARI